MKNIIPIILILLCIKGHTQTTILGYIKNYTRSEKVAITPAFDNWLYASDTKKTEPDTAGHFSIGLNINYPQFIVLNYKTIRIKLYAEPLKTLSLSFDAENYLHTASFSKSLKKENTFLLQTGIFFFDLLPHNWNDSETAPLEILHQMQSVQTTALTKLDSLRPFTTKAFQQLARAEIEYFAASKLLDLSFKAGVWWTNNADKPAIYDLAEWQAAIKIAYDAYPICNNLATDSYNYMNAINNLSFFINSKFTDKNHMVVEMQKVMGMPVADIKTTLQKKGKSYLEYKQFKYYLTGTALQKALASFIKRQVEQGNLECVDEVYADFTTHYPPSRYATYVQQAIKPYLAALKIKSGDKTVFVTDSSATFNQVISSLKGKVVYVDIWGTWCPPCREEMLYAPALQEKFDNKPVAFVYIAYEHNTTPEKNWRETLHFFKLNGMHVLANNYIKKYIQDMYKNDLKFPSYILIDKQGNIVNNNAAAPSSMDEITKQIDALL